MVIKMFEEKYTSIWENVVILAKEGKEDTKKSFQGALTAVSELERGHQDVVDSIQCVAYTLGAGGISESQPKSKLERALLRISKPVRVVFGDQECVDCGQRGDERLLSDLCHEKKVEAKKK